MESVVREDDTFFYVFFNNTNIHYHFLKNEVKNNKNKFILIWILISFIV